MAAERLEIAPELAEMDRLGDWAEAFCERHALPAKSNFALRLCLEEAVSNSIRHGGLAAGDRIEVSLEVGGGGMTAEIADPGIPFDPLQAPKPGVAASLEDAVIGGQGIELMRRFCCAMEYRRSEDINRLRLRFEIPA